MCAFSGVPAGGLLQAHTRHDEVVVPRRLSISSREKENHICDTTLANLFCHFPNPSLRTCRSPLHPVGIRGERRGSSLTSEFACGGAPVLSSGSQADRQPCGLAGFLNCTRVMADCQEGQFPENIQRPGKGRWYNLSSLSLFGVKTQAT